VLWPAWRVALITFAGIACHDAWKPYDGYDGVAGHALCGAHLLRELTAVTETGTDDDVIWAQQAIDALLELSKAAGAAREAGRGAIDAEVLGNQSRWFREAADAGIVLNTARRGTLQKKRHALATRMRGRAGDYLLFARDLRVPVTQCEISDAWPKAITVSFYFGHHCRSPVNAGRAVLAGEVQVPFGDAADRFLLLGAALVVIGDRVFPDAATDREPDEAVHGCGDREPVVQPVGGRVAAEHDRADAVPPARAHLGYHGPGGLGRL
jgi:hypothetical protein